MSITPLNRRAFLSQLAAATFTLSAMPLARAAAAPASKPNLVYILANVPHELYNVYAQHPDIVARLSAQLETIKQSGHSRY